LATLTVVASSSLVAHAQAALDDDKKAAPTPTTDAAVAPNTPAGEKPVEYGIDIRMRSVWVPRGEIELFVDRAAGGSQDLGFGFDLLRRRGTLELALGFEFEHVSAAQGVWVNKGDAPNIGPGANQAAVDYILSTKNGSDLGWASIEFSFFNHAPIAKYIAFRYGFGAGVGIITGKLMRYNLYCAAGASSPNSLEPYCVPPQLNGTGMLSNDPQKCGGNQPCAYNMPPVFPVVNAIVGFQIKPVEKMVINIEGGIRTLLFLGLSVGYYL
jgi:hypothetical protein